MSRIIPVFLMTVMWSALFATTDLRAVAVGVVMSWSLLAIAQRLENRGESGHGEGWSRRTGLWPRRARMWPDPIGVVVLCFFFFRELLLSGLSVAKESWRPQLAIRPGIVAVPLELDSDLEIALLASLISLTPGTLSIEVTPDKKTLYVHALTVQGDGSEIRQSIAERLERPVRGAFRVRRLDSVGQNAG